MTKRKTPVSAQPEIPPVRDIDVLIVSRLAATALELSALLMQARHLPNVMLALVQSQSPGRLVMPRLEAQIHELGQEAADVARRFRSEVIRRENAKLDKGKEAP